MEKNQEIPNSKQSNRIKSSKKNAKWAEETEFINAVGVQRRSAEQFKWEGLQQGPKSPSRTLGNIRSKPEEDNLGLKPLTAAEWKIIDLMTDQIIQWHCWGF